MKKIKFITFCLLLNMVLCNVLAAQTRIAVLPFTPDEKISKAAMSYLTEIFTVEMVNSRKFTVVERARLDAALKEMQMQSGDMFDESSAVELGKMSGAEMVFFGTIFRFGGRELLSIKGMDIKTATLKYAKQEKGGNDLMLEKAVKLMAKQIIEETVGVAGSAESLDTMERLRNKKAEKTAKYNPAETKFYQKYIEDKWGISPDNKEDMLHYYQINRKGGIACIAAGASLLGIGATLIAILTPVGFIPFYDRDKDMYEYRLFGGFYAGLGVGIPLLVAGLIVTPMSAVCFSHANKIKSIYKKTTGEKLRSFLQRSSIGGGYDWDKKEVTVAMAIRL